MSRTALGLIETLGYVGAIAGADAAVKAAVVTIDRMEFVKGGIVAVLIKGDVGAVRAAVEAGESEARRVGKFRTSHIIPSLSTDVTDMLFKKPVVKPEPEVKPESASEEGSGNTVSVETVESVEVVEVAETIQPAETQTVVETVDVIEKVETAVVQAEMPKKTSGLPQKSKEELLAMKVVKLRNMARNLDGIGIEKNKIKFANKDELVNAILAYYERRTGR